MWRHLADPAHQEKLPNSAGFRIVELIAEGGGEAEIVEVGQSQVVRIFQEALLLAFFATFLVTTETFSFLHLRPGHAGFLPQQPFRVWRATPRIHLEISIQFISGNYFHLNVAD